MTKIKRLFAYTLASITVVVLYFTIQTSPMAAASAANSVYLGGEPIGVIQKCDGVVVSSFVDVETDGATFSPAKRDGILLGDVVQSVNGRMVHTPSDVSAACSSGGSAVLSVKRGMASIEVTVSPAYDIVEHSFKLGITVKNEMAGVGTMSYILPNGKFGAVGHKIFDPNISYPDAFSVGDLYDCEIKGVRCGSNGKAGELCGSFSKKSLLKGKVEKNLFCGLFGQLDFAPENRTLIAVGGRESVVLGGAEIYTTIEGREPKPYQIEIVKAAKQDSQGDKSMVIRVVDDALLSVSGGIVQGMSGSPIVQNGKLIGAVTHVFLNDAKIGYGIYIDWMLQNQ